MGRLNEYDDVERKVIEPTRLIEPIRYVIDERPPFKFELGPIAVSGTYEDVLRFLREKEKE